MTDTLCDWDAFVAKYVPVKNHLIRQHSDLPLDGCMFETYGLAHEAIRNVIALVPEGPLLIWTLIDADEGLVLLQGYHFVNRLGYVIATVPYAEGDPDEYEC